METIKQFVPVGSASLVSDAPGWNVDVEDQKSQDDDDNNNTASASAGPICWKCKGTGSKPVHKKNKKKDDSISCSVCDGSGRLPSKKRERESSRRPGEITMPRRHVEGWVASGPLPFALWAADADTADHFSSEQTEEIDLYKACLRDKRAVYIPETMYTKKNTAPWLPRYGDQLCNLVGKWRILQRVGSHRWTTDDLVTAYVAAKQIEARIQQSQRSSSNHNNNNQTFNYLDLGCGNGSVLTMTTWKLCQLLGGKVGLLRCIGVEARKEAMDLCQRSLAFNVGQGYDDKESSSKQNIKAQEGCCPIHASVRRGDFRELESMTLEERADEKGNTATTTTFEGQFDLVTGTPPYFRVDFKVSNTTSTASVDRENNNKEESTSSSSLQVEGAVINQGGMPSCMQSAPARCEFRGGIEAYCKAASFAMKPNGTFIVCENWLNDDRVRQGAREAGLLIVETVRVKGSVERPEPLFAVYTMKKKNLGDDMNQEFKAKVPPCLSVRDEHGKWTKQYGEEVLEWMSIPAKHDMGDE